MSVLILAAAIVAAPSSSPAKDGWKNSTPAEARQVLNAYARCAVRYESALAERFVLMNDGEKLPEAEFRRLFDGRCLGFRGGQMRARSWRSRAALAEALLTWKSAKFRQAPFASVPPLVWSAQPPEAGASPTADELQITQAEMQISALGECVARSNPAGVLAVLRTKVDSKDEMAGLKALSAPIAGCVQKGETLAFNRSSLRAGMALAYYRLASSASAAPATAGTN